MKSQQNGFCTFTSVNLAQQVVLRRLLEDQLKKKYKEYNDPQILNQKVQYLFKQLIAETCDHHLQAAKTCLKAENYKSNQNQYTRRICVIFYWLCSFIPMINNFCQDFLNKRVLNALYSEYHDAKAAAGTPPALVVVNTIPPPAATTVDGNSQDLANSPKSIVDERAALRAVIADGKAPKPAPPVGPDLEKKKKTGWGFFSKKH